MLVIRELTPLLVERVEEKEEERENCEGRRLKGWWSDWRLKCKGDDKGKFYAIFKKN